jgi:uracil-DNA glycosylase
MKDGIHLQVGSRTKVALVFSCPGQFEEKNGGPVKGKTGDNLKVVLDNIQGKSGFPKKLILEELRITNSWDGVLYKKKDNRTEAKLNTAEIYSERNLQRLEDELKDIEDVIICFGKKAFKALAKIKDRLPSNVIILESSHLSLQSLNRVIKKDVNDTILTKGDPNNTALRLQVVSKKIIDQT